MGKVSLLILLFMTSCTVGPDYKNIEIFDDVEIQKSIGLDDVESDEHSFSPYDFGDEILNNFMDEVQETSPNIKIALLKLRQVRENLRITLKNGFPSFDFTGKYNYVNESKNMGYLLNSDYYQAGIDMSWEIDIFGNTRRQAEASRARFMAELYNLKNVNVSLVSEVVNNYINLRNAQQQLKNAKENLQIQEEAYNVILSQYNVDLTDEITLSEAKYLVENTKMQIPQLEYQREMYANLLAILLGKLPGDINTILEDDNNNLVKNPFSYDVEKLYKLPVDVIRNRPDVKMAEQNLIAQNAEVGVAISNLYPKLSISGFLGFQSKKWSNLVESDSSTSSIIPGVSLPIFNWGQLRGNVRIQKLLKEEALLNYENTLLSAVAEVRNAIVAVEKEYQRNRASIDAYNNMQLVARLNWKKYKLGLINYTDVLNAEQRRLTAQTDMVNSNANLYKYLVVFYKAIGGKPLQIIREE